MIIKDTAKQSSKSSGLPSRGGYGVRNPPHNVNQEPLVVKDKVGRTPGEFDVSKVVGWLVGWLRHLYLVPQSPTVTAAPVDDC